MRELLELKARRQFLVVCSIISLDVHSIRRTVSKHTAVPADLDDDGDLDLDLIITSECNNIYASNVDRDSTDTNMQRDFTNPSYISLYFCCYCS